ncbi:GntR family transcriptional regulator [Nonomuraea sp. NPDC050663]|uniref:GntR family transcriptional regulator n=1 Tax=Nonomuraea sp. NPDC050663 TaxID=3364370 RepID=UPI0037B0FA70
MKPTARSAYQEVAALIRSRIEDGTYPRGSRLPTEEQWADEFGYTRVTINAALRVLANEGLVIRARKRGTFVRPIDPIVRRSGARHLKQARERGGAHGAFDAELAERGYTYRPADTDIRRDRPPALVAELLDVPADEASTVVRDRRMSIIYAHNQPAVPYQIATTWIPLDIAGDTAIEQQDTGVGGISSRLEELGFEQVRFPERIRTRPPSSAEAHFLEISEEQLVDEILHRGVTAEGRVVKVTMFVIPTHLVIHEIE